MTITIIVATKTFAFTRLAVTLGFITYASGTKWIMVVSEEALTSSHPVSNSVSGHIVASKNTKSGVYCTTLMSTST